MFIILAVTLFLLATEIKCFNLFCVLLQGIH